MKVLVVGAPLDEIDAAHASWRERGVEATFVEAQEDLSEAVVSSYDFVCVTAQRALELRHERAERAQDASLRARESEIFQRIVDHMPVLLQMLDEHGNVLWVNGEFERALGYTLAEVRGKDMMPLLYPDADERRRVSDIVTRANGGWFELKLSSKAGKGIWQSWSHVRLSDGTTVGLGRDIHEAKMAEDLRDRFIEDVMQAQEDERRRLALELHDETGQSLTTLLVGLKSLEDTLTNPEHSQHVAALRELTSKMVREVGRLARGLRPTVLDDLGFVPAVEMHVAEFSRVHPVRVDLHLSGFARRERLPPRIETHLYRIVQEALTNVARHASASEVSVVLRHDGSTVQAIIEDNGRGLGDSHHTETRLASIRERVSMLVGTLTVESTPGQGTALYITIPVLALA